MESMIEDKLQLFLVVPCMLGEFLPVQLIYQGKSNKCHPSFQFQPEWHITHSPNHWSNENTMKDYVLKILVPHIIEKRKQLKLYAATIMLWLFMTC